jgi:hypothetical protein
MSLRHIKKLAKFMGCEFSGEEKVGGVVSAIVELCSLGKLKDMEVNRNGSSRLGVKNESYFRKGISGDWSNHMRMHCKGLDSPLRAQGEPPLAYILIYSIGCKLQNVKMN